MQGPGVASREYLKNAVMTASPEQLHLMLIDGAIRFAQRGRAGLEAKDFERAFDGFDRAQQIVIELNNGLQRDKNPEVVEPMLSLNNFVFRRLVDANVKHDLQAVEDVLRILRHQRETWLIVVDKIRREEGVLPMTSESPDGPTAAPPTTPASPRRAKSPFHAPASEPAGGLSIQI